MSHLFILGPSGVGKTKLGIQLALGHEFLHIEIDKFPDGDGIDLEHLRLKWDQYFKRLKARPIADELSRRAKARGKVVLCPDFSE